MYCLCLLRHFKFKALKQRSWVSEPCSKHPNPHKELQCASSQRWAGAPWPPKKQIMIQWFIWFMSSIHLLWFDVIYSSTCGASSEARRPGKAESHYSSRNPNDLNHRLDSRRDLTPAAALYSLRHLMHADLIHKDANIRIGGHAGNAVVLLLQSVQLTPAIIQLSVHKYCGLASLWLMK